MFPPPGGSGLERHRLLSENSHEAFTYFRLRVRQCRFQRREVRHISRTRKKPEKSRSCILWIKSARQAQSQDLRQIVVKLDRRPQNFGILDRQYIQCPRLVEHTHRRRVEDFRKSMRVNELQILRDKLDIDQAAGGVFQVPARPVTLL